MAKITYENKVALNVNSDIADVNKCNASDLNEIKNVVNENDDNTTNNSNAIGTLSSLNTTNKSNLVSAINEVNTILGTIIESGNNSNGNWVKFEDGTMITYQEIEVEIACNTAWGNLFVGNYATAINFPQTFKELPKVLIDLKLKKGACFKVEWEVPIITTSSYKNIGIGRGTTSDAVSLTITLYAIGKWK